MGRLISQESSSETAHNCLDKLTADIFHHSMTSEEAYFVAEMARGVDGAVAGKVCN
jgi:mediator of RNA polymerase II transcription subunit 12